jgi:hypothetical protein
MSANTRQVGGVTIVDISGRIVFGAEATLTALTKKAEESGLRGMWDAALQFTSKDDQKQDPFGTASAYTYAGRKDEALTWLERAFDERSFGIAWLAVDPTFDSLHSESRYQVLAAKLRIPQK